MSDVQTSATIASLRAEVERLTQSVDNWRQAHNTVSAMLTTAEKELDTARERAGVLEREVRAWRDACDTWQAQTQPLLESLSAAVAETDRLNALDAAKFGGAT